MDRRNRVAPRVELLEGRSLLSYVPVMPSVAKVHHTPIVHLVPKGHPQVQAVNGTVSGSYVLGTNNGTDTTLSFQGRGTVNPFGPVTAYHGPSVVPTKLPRFVDLSFTGADGSSSVNIRFTRGRGPLDLNASQQHGQFRIIGGTGLYAHAVGGGNADLSINPGANNGATGGFALALNGRTRF